MSPIRLQPLDFKYEREERKWLWPNRIPMDRVTLLSGDWGAGKTHFYADIVSRIMHQEAFPDGVFPGVPASNVLILTTESEDVDLVEVLEAQGVDQTDRKKVILGDYNEIQGRLTNIDLDKDFAAVVEAIVSAKPILVILDPLLEFHTRNEIDAHAIRALMIKLHGLCVKYHFAMLAIVHWNKDEKASRRNRMSGSHQYGAAVRSMMTISMDSKDRGLRHLHQDKMSLGLTPETLDFRITPPEGMVVWEDEAGGEDTGGSRLAEAEAWLKNNLIDGPLTIDEVVKRSGMSLATINRARHKLGEQILTVRETINGKQVSKWEAISKRNNWGNGELSVDPPSGSQRRQWDD